MTPRQPFTSNIQAPLAYDKNILFKRWDSLPFCWGLQTIQRDTPAACIPEDFFGSLGNTIFQAKPPLTGAAGGIPRCHPSVLRRHLPQRGAGSLGPVQTYLPNEPSDPPSKRTYLLTTQAKKDLNPFPLRIQWNFPTKTEAKTSGLSIKRQRVYRPTQRSNFSARGDVFCPSPPTTDSSDSAACCFPMPVTKQPLFNRAFPKQPSKRVAKEQRQLNNRSLKKSTWYKVIPLFPEISCFQIKAPNLSHEVFFNTAAGRLRLVRWSGCLVVFLFATNAIGSLLHFQCCCFAGGLIGGEEGV